MGRLELSAIIAAHMVRFSVLEDEPIKDIEHLCRAHPILDLNTQGFAGVFIEHGQHLVRSATGQAIMHEVDAPDMVLVKRAKPDDRTVLMVQPLALSLTLRELQAFLSPKPGHLLCVDRPTFNAKQFCNLAIPVPTVLFGQPDHRQTQIMIILAWDSGSVIEAGSGQTDCSTCAALRGRKPLADMDHGLTKVGSRQALGFR